MTDEVQAIHVWRDYRRLLQFCCLVAFHAHVLINMFHPRPLLSCCRLFCSDKCVLQEYMQTPHFPKS